MPQPQQPQSIRLEFDYQGENIQLSHAEKISMMAFASDDLKGNKNAVGFWFEIRGKGQEILYKKGRHRPMGFQVELYSEEKGQIKPTIHRVENPEGSFEILFPVIDHAEEVVLFSSLGSQTPAREIARFHLAKLNYNNPRSYNHSTSNSNGKFIGFKKVVDNIKNVYSLDIAIISEGYTASEMDTFAIDVDDFIETLFKTPPFDLGLVQSAINIYRFDFASTDSGAKDPVACGGTGADPKTFFESSFCWNQKNREYLWLDYKRVKKVVGCIVPDIGMFLVLVNSPIHGGRGGDGLAIFSRTSNWHSLAIHEMGHLFNLADEYDVDKPTPKYTGGEPNHPNITAAQTRTEFQGLMDIAKTRWYRLIDPSTAIPSLPNHYCPNPPNFPNPYPPDTVGTYEGAGSHNCGLYRPEFDCLMRTVDKIGVPFCKVCQKAILNAMSRFFAFRLVYFFGDYLVLKSDTGKYLTPISIEGSNYIVAAREHIDWTTQFKLVALPGMGNLISLKAYNDLYLNRGTGVYQNYICADQSSIDAKARFSLNYPFFTTGKIALAEGKWWKRVTLSTGQEFILVKNSSLTPIDPANFFDAFILKRKERIRFQADNGLYWTISILYNHRIVIRTSSSSRTFSEFIVTRFTNGKIAIQTRGGKYLAVDTVPVGQVEPLRPKLDFITDETLFSTIPLENGKYAIRASNGKFLRRRTQRPMMNWIEMGDHTIDSSSQFTINF